MAKFELISGSDQWKEQWILFILFNDLRLMYNRRKNIQQHFFVYITCFVVISKCNIWDDCNSGWSLIHSKNLGDWWFLSLVILINCIFIKKVFMHWYASTRHNWKIPEYSRTSSVLFTVRKLEVWEFQILRIFFHLRKFFWL